MLTSSRRSFAQRLVFCRYHYQPFNLIYIKHVMQNEFGGWKYVLDSLACNEMVVMCLCSHQVITTKSRQNFQQLKCLILALRIGQLLWITRLCILTVTYIHTYARLMALFPGLPGWASTRKVKPIWILLKQEIVSGSGISWAICQSAPRSRQTTTPAPHHSVFYRPDALPAAQPTASKHRRNTQIATTED